MDACHRRNAARRAFPPSAILNGDKIVEALAFGLISSGLHSVLICGPSGTGKSIAARSVAILAPDKDVIEIPAGVILDQLFGTVDLEKAIRQGKREPSDSILSRADGNVLIADNINLLPSGILCGLMNAVQECEVAPDAGGASASFGCNTFLIGTMNPDEGDLDEHVMDRFDMCVYTDGLVFPEERRELIRRVMAYERDPSGFSSGYADSDDRIRSRIGSADCSKVSIPDGFPKMISEICDAMHVEGHRGDVAVVKAVCASAAFEGRKTATVDDLKRATILCLQHRRREMPPPQDDPDFESPMDSEETSDDTPEDRETTPNQDPQNSGSGSREQSDGQTSDGDGDDGEGSAGEASERTFEIGAQFDVRDYIPPESRRSRNKRSGRQDSSVSDDGSGRVTGFMIPKGKVRDVALVPSIRAAAPYQICRDHHGLAVVLKKDDLRERVRVRRKGTTILFVVDGSGSMGAQSRMVAVKGAVLSMLDDAYRRRDSVGLAVFRGDGAELILPPTRSVLTAYRSLRELPTGGRTPLSEGIRVGYEVLRREAESGSEPVMVVLTDGRGNVKGGGYSSAEESLKVTAEVVADSGIRTIVVDTEVGLVRFGKALDLAVMMDSAYIQLDDLNADRLSESVRSALDLMQS